MQNRRVWWIRTSWIQNPKLHFYLSFLWLGEDLREKKQEIRKKLEGRGRERERVRANNLYIFTGSDMPQVVLPPSFFPLSAPSRAQRLGLSVPFHVLQVSCLALLMSWSFFNSGLTWCQYKIYFTLKYLRYTNLTFTTQWIFCIYHLLSHRSDKYVDFQHSFLVNTHR